MVNSRWTGPFERGIANALTVEVEERRDVFPSKPAGASSAGASVGRLLELLAHTRSKATFFVLGAVAERNPAVVRMIVDGGHEIGCHGQTHQPVGDRTPDEFRADLRQAREVLRDITGTSVDAYRAPGFSLTPACRWALDVLIQEGFLFDNSIDPARHDRSGMLATPVEPYPIGRQDGSLWELPPPVWPGLSSPRFDLYALTRHGLQHANAAGRPFVTSLTTRQLEGSHGARTEKRLGRLLQDFAFTPVSQTVAEWLERVGRRQMRKAA